MPALWKGSSNNQNPLWKVQSKIIFQKLNASIWSALVFTEWEISLKGNHTKKQKQRMPRPTFTNIYVKKHFDQQTAISSPIVECLGFHYLQCFFNLS